MRTLLFILALFAPFNLASAQAMFGSGIAVDGDTLDIGNERIRLHGIDAVEANQTCNRDDVEWACGNEAKALLAEFIAGQSLVCQQVDRDKYGRLVAVCRASKRDLAEMMVGAGYAIALPQYSEAYVEAEADARRRLAGIWNSEFDKPADFRLAHPYSIPPATNPKALASRTNQRPSGSSNGVYFRNCTEARAAGAAPIYRGQPGYRPQMDGDGDGIACEPYRGR